MRHTPTKPQKAEIKQTENTKPRLGNVPFTRFHCSYREMTLEEGKTRVRGSETRYENGKLSTKTFEGEMEGDHLSGALEETYRLIRGPLKSFFSHLLPGDSDAEEPALRDKPDRRRR
jgi:hypothetical protein